MSAPIPPASDSDPQLPRELDDVLARGPRRSRSTGFATAADFVDSLRDALGRAAGTTRVAAIAPVPPARSRRRVPLLLLLLAGALAAGILAAALLARGDGETAGTTAPRTVQKTVTLPGATVVRTVTTAPEPPATTTAASPPATSGSELNDQGFQLLRAGRYEEALPLLEQAVAGLSGDGGLAEAYASYNLAFARLALGRCDGVLELLDRSEQLQGRRKEISRLRKEAERNCGEQ